MNGYVPGTNGLVYGPQGGRVIRIPELVKIMKILS